MEIIYWSTYVNIFSYTCMSINGCYTVSPELTPCQLVCQADGGSIVAVRAPSVIDGTKCISDESPTAVCIQGGCTVS